MESFLFIVNLLFLYSAQVLSLYLKAQLFFVVICLFSIHLPSVIHWVSQVWRNAEVNVWAQPWRQYMWAPWTIHCACLLPERLNTAYGKHLHISWEPLGLSDGSSYTCFLCRLKKHKRKLNWRAHCSIDSSQMEADDLLQFPFYL